MARRKPKERRVAAPTAYCAFHDRMMNDNYIRARRCTLKGKHGPCKHLRWLPCKGEHSKGEEENAQSVPD